MSAGDVVAIYAAVLSTLLAVPRVWSWWFARQVRLAFTYGWEENAGERPRLRITIVNHSRVAIAQLLQVGYDGPGGLGSYTDDWGPATIALNPGEGHTFEFEIRPLPRTLRGYALVADGAFVRRLEAAATYEPQHFGVALLDEGDELTLTSVSSGPAGTSRTTSRWRRLPRRPR